VLVERDEQAPDKFLVPPRRRGGHEELPVAELPARTVVRECAVVLVGEIPGIPDGHEPILPLYASVR